MLFLSVFLLLLLFSFSSSSPIYSLPPILRSQNALSLTHLTLYLSFSTPLPPSSILHLTLPFTISSSSLFTLTPFSSSLPPSPLLYPPPSSTSSLPSSSVLLLLSSSDPSFYLSTPSLIQSNLWYSLEILISDSSSQTPGHKGCIALETYPPEASGCSSSNPSGCSPSYSPNDLTFPPPPFLYFSSTFNDFLQIIDENQCAAELILAPEVASLDTVAGYLGEDGTKSGTLGGLSRVWLEWVPNRVLMEGGVFEGELEGGDFVWESCLNVKCVATDGVCTRTVEGVTDAKCYVSGNKFSFAVNSNITARPMRLQLGLRNPFKFVKDARKFTFRLKAKGTEFWYGKAEIPSTSVSVRTTYSTTAVSDLKVKLFWGLITREEGTTKGCPIVLYSKKSSGSLEVFNTIRTEFRINTDIPAFQSSDYLTVVWTLTAQISTLLKSSVMSNLPIVKGKKFVFTFDSTAGLIIFTNIDSLSASQKFILSCKISLVSASADTYVEIGGVEVKLGDDTYSVTSADGISHAVKMNQEYIDTTATTGWFASAQRAKNYYNYFYSYSHNLNNLAFVSGTNSISDIYARITTLFLSASSKNGVFVKPSSSTDIQGIYFALSATNTQVCKNGLGNIASKCTGSSTNDGLNIMLKIVFNNNVLSISTADFPKGVVPVGSIFSNTDGTGAGYSGYNTAATQGKQLNKIEAEIQNEDGGGTYHHATLVCKQASAANEYCHSLVGRTATTVGGIAFIGTNVAKVSGLYADDIVMDFIVCFKFMIFASFEPILSIAESFFGLYEDTGTHGGGPGLIHGYAITGGRSSFFTGDIKISLANYYYKSGTTTFGDGKFIASYLRVSFTFSSDIVESSFLGIFFHGGANSEGLSFYSSSENKLNIIDFKSSTQISSDVKQGSSSSNLENIYYLHSGLIIPIKVFPQKSFDFYIPLKITSSTITSLVLVLLDSLASPYSNFFSSKSAYRLLGAQFASSTADLFAIVENNDQTPFTTTPTAFTNDASTGCASSTNVPKFVRDTNVYKPGNKITSLVINSDLGVNGAGSKCGISLNSGTNWGGVFVVYGEENYFSGLTLTWGLEGSSKIANKCMFHSFECQASRGCKGVAKDVIFYTILCSTDTGDGVPVVGPSTNMALKMKDFVWPFYWGANFDIINKVKYVWSLANGNGVSVVGEGGTSADWIEGLCTVSGVGGIPLNTLDFTYNFLIYNKVNYIVEPGKNILIEHVILNGLSGVKYAECYHESLVCSPTDSVFSLSNEDDENKVMVKAGTILINTVIDTPAQFTATTYSTKIKYNNIVIETCSEAKPADYRIEGSFASPIIQLTAFKYVNMQSARFGFSFSFQINKVIRSSMYYAVNLGFFTNPTFNQKNYKFSIYWNDLRSISFAKIDASDFTSLKLYALDRIPVNTIFTFFCDGCSSSDNTLNTAISASLLRKDGKEVVVMEDSRKITTFNLNVNKELSNVVLTRKNSFPNLECNYEITFKPIANEISIYGRIYITFPKSYLPALNPVGQLYCTLESVLVYCDIIDVRSISISPHITLKTTSSTSYKLVISGVLLPNTKDENFNIFFALDTNSDPFDGISESISLVQPDLSSIVPEINIIEDINFANQLIRNGNTLRIQLQMSKVMTSVGPHKFLFQLPWIFYESLYLNPSVTCSIIDTTKLSEMGENCSYIGETKILIFLKKDVTISLGGLTLNFTISNLYSPQKYSYPPFSGFYSISHLNSDNVTLSIARGVRNVTDFTNFTSNVNKALLIWEEENLFRNEPINILQNVYSTKLTLRRKDGDFPSSCKFKITESGFQTIPKDLYFGAGVPTMSFKIAADSSKIPGIYVITFTKTSDDINAYDPIGGLLVRVSAEPCQPEVSTTSVKISQGSLSPPIFLDFSNCLPSLASTVTLNITSGFDEFYLGIGNQRSKEYSLNSNTSDLLNYKLLFFVSNFAMTKQTGQGILSFSFKPNEYFISPKNISLNLVSYQISPKPVVTINNIVPAPGNSKISVSCDQIGVIYYGIGVEKSMNEISWYLIKNLTEKQRVSRTVLDKKDKFWKIYGFVNNLAGENIELFFEEGLLRANGNYSFVAFCKNQANLVGDSLKQDWKQPSNGGKTTKIKFTLKSELNSLQKTELSCLLTFYFQISPELIFNDEGTICKKYSSRLLANITMTALSNVISTYYWYILPDLIKMEDQNFVKVSNEAKKSTFFSNLIKNSKVSFPEIMESGVSVLDEEISPIAPILEYLKVDANETAFTFTAMLNNTNGYIYIGVGFRNHSRPKANQLKAGFDGNDNLFVAKKNILAEKGNEVKMIIGGLMNKTEYFIYSLASTENLGFESAESELINFATYTDEGARIAFKLIIMILLILILV